MPAGRLAELTGLTTGAITGIIDRLEKRVNDPKDRRIT
jgi:DNA-binding MarR family transcriptional regulator